jgi:hypothetical protein
MTISARRVCEYPCPPLFSWSMTSTMLEDLGCRVIPCGSAEQALNKLKNGSRGISILMTDVEMPAVDGIGTGHPGAADQARTCGSYLHRAGRE